MRRLLAMVILCGCEAPDGIYHGDLAFSVSERAQIEYGNEWIAAQVGRDPFPIVWDGRDMGYSIRREFIASGAAGTFQAKTHRIVLDAGLSNLFLASVAAHEFGHAHGLSGAHHCGPGLMGPHGGQVLEWTVEDQQMCESEGVCR